MGALLDRITLDPAVCHGQPTVWGLRYPVANLLDVMGSMTREEILVDCPDLEEDDLRAALCYAALVVRAGIKGHRFFTESAP